MTKSTFENMFQTIPLVQKGMEIGSSPIPKEQAEHFPGCVSGTLYYAEKQNESQCVAFGVTFPEYYVIAATLQDGRQISIRKETEEELYDLLYRVFYAPERITEPNNYGEYRRSHSVAFFTFSFGLRSSHGIPIPHINAHLLEIMDIFTFPNGETKMHKYLSPECTLALLWIAISFAWDRYSGTPFVLWKSAMEAVGFALAGDAITAVLYTVRISMIVRKIRRDLQ